MFSGKTIMAENHIALVFYLKDSHCLKTITFWVQMKTFQEFKKAMEVI